MQLPRQKSVSRFSFTLLRMAVVYYLVKLFDGRVYDERKDCPECGSTHVVRHDWYPRLLCKVILEDDRFKDVVILVKRFVCKRCRAVFLADAPFYDGANYGRPIVDLCLALAASNPYNRVETILMSLGIQVDKCSIQSYCQLFKERVEEKAGIAFLNDDRGLNMLKILFDAKDVEELKRKYPEEKYDAVGDEMYPSIKGARKALHESNYQRMVDGEKPERYPRGFCTAATYLNHLKCFSSILTHLMDWNMVSATVLLKPVRGNDSLTTDGHGAYNVEPHERCLIHKARNEAKRDPVLRRMKKEKKPLREIKEHLSRQYQALKEKEVEILKLKHPQLTDENGNYIGVVNTNILEGGWRIKSELRVPYEKIESFTSRVYLAALKDSLYTFRYGRPCEGFGNMHSDFTFSKAMGGVIAEAIEPPPIIKHDLYGDTVMITLAPAAS